MRIAACDYAGQRGVSLAALLKAVNGRCVNGSPLARAPCRDRANPLDRTSEAIRPSGPARPHA
jgi:hypothetical protein